MSDKPTYTSQSTVRSFWQEYRSLKGFRPALKIDWANFLEHVVLDTSEGGVRRILFTPDDSKEFKTTLDEALSQYRRSRSTNSG